MTTLRAHGSQLTPPRIETSAWRQSSPEAAGGPSEAQRLLTRMRAGDRDAAATFITSYGSRLRRRVRGKLNPAMRRIFDSQEILSTVGRRLDLYVRDGRLEAANIDQLWALLFRMANNAVVDKARVYRRLRETEGEDGPFAQTLLSRLRRAEQHQGADVEIEIGRAMKLFDDTVDRQILSLWLAGTPHGEIATLVEMPPATVRKRWSKIKGTLQIRFASETGR